MELWSKKLLMAGGGGDATTPYEYTSGTYRYSSEETDWATKTIYEGAIPYKGNYTIRVAGSCGYKYGQYEVSGAMAAGGMLDVTGAFKVGDTIKMVLINSQYTATTNNNARGGCGMACYVNNELIAVAGGGGGCVFSTRTTLGKKRSCLSASGGGGYQGGNPQHSLPGAAESGVGRGYSLDGTVGDYQTSDTSNGDGLTAVYNHATLDNAILAYPGSGYKNTTAGYTITNPGTNGGGAYFSITRNL